MKTSIFVPKKINVGYQNRSDTYTGKLAYVIYTDEKGKLRKEKSWNGWRNKDIVPDEFENVPTEGFVLNRRAGGVEESWGWNARKTYCRVYDPRNFEFEISIENLLYILENATSTKGKGLEGLFVYGWDGADLVLLPVDSPDYKEISEYNERMHNRNVIKAKDLIVGATYLAKDNTEMVYMGKFDYYSSGYMWLESGEYKSSKNYNDIPYQKDRYGCRSCINHASIDYLYGKYFWFAYKVENYTYMCDKKVYDGTYSWGFAQYKSVPTAKLIGCINETCTPDYADIYEQMNHSYNFSPRDLQNKKYVPYLYEEFKEHIENRHYKFYSKSGYLYEVNLYDKENMKWTAQKVWIWNDTIKENNKDFKDRFEFETIEKRGFYSWQISKETRMVPMTIKELYERLEPCYAEIYLKNGNLYERTYYYGDKK